MFAGKGIQLYDPMVVIVGAYSMFVSKARVRRIEETNEAAQFENSMTLVLIVGA